MRIMFVPNIVGHRLESVRLVAVRHPASAAGTHGRDSTRAIRGVAVAAIVCAAAWAGIFSLVF